MPEHDMSPEDARRGDLFDNLPAANTSLPGETPREAPAAGSRRAAREARRAAESGAGGNADDATRVNPVVTDTTSATTDATADATEQHAAPSAPASTPAADDVPPHESDLHALFAPEKHEPAPKPRRRRGWLVALIIVAVIFGGVAAGGAWVWSIYGDRISDAMGWGEPKDYEEGIAEGEALVTIKEGDTGGPVSTALYEAGVTKTQGVFYDYLIAENPSAVFYPGVYQLQKKMTAAAAFAALSDPANKLENTVGIPEGGTVASSLPRIVEGVGIPLEDLEAAVEDPAVYGVDADSLEGWLFPAVYTFDPDATAEDVIGRMVARTRESLSAAGVTDADAQRILTIASIIQREGRTADFDKVSRVIQNRLDQGMKLQMDSTSQYGYGELHAGSVSTSKEAQNDDNPWNTYVIEGLPVGPIANPSDAAIEAAIHPADGPWLYFVTINLNTGETQFSETYEGHQQGIDKWHSWCRENPDAGC
ncbi:endolytic transglycosylase MltG [Microbacterium istanbulense]|uniref:Endolytic murein transglycosylase n=1 Tax=Microbacterium istanbulense TaxID=3122049 RepID=A0ABU8LQ01_9MICO